MTSLGNRRCGGFGRKKVVIEQIVLRLVAHSREMPFHWRAKGHSRNVIRGGTEIRFPNEKRTYTAGDGVCIPDGHERRHAGKILADTMTVFLFSSHNRWDSDVRRRPGRTIHRNGLFCGAANRRRAALHRNGTLIKGKKEIAEYYGWQSDEQVRLEWDPECVRVSAGGDLGTPMESPSTKEPMRRERRCTWKAFSTRCGRGNRTVGGGTCGISPRAASRRLRRIRLLRRKRTGRRTPFRNAGCSASYPSVMIWV